MSEQNDSRTYTGYLDNLKSRLYGVMCDREREEKGEVTDWEKCLFKIITELEGMEIRLNSINYWKLLAKLNIMVRLNWKYFRKTFFECMNLLGVINDDELS